MILFQLAQPAGQDRFYSFQIDEKMVHLLIPPQVLKGEKTGYLRVQSLVAGKTQIEIGGAKLGVEIAPDPVISTIGELRPEIVTPAAGSQVWGKFAVGVQQLAMGDPGQLPAPVLRLPGGQEIAGHAVPNQKIGPHARWVFEVNADDLAPGANALVAVTKDSSGREVTGEPVFINAIRPDASSMLTGLCTDGADTDRPADDGPRPPNVMDDAQFGVKSIVDNTNENQSWCLPVWTDTRGQYQLFVTARGEMGGDALPTLGLNIDETYQPETTVRLATTEWQRIPVGHPVTLDEGGHFLTVRARNGFNQGADDMRMLFLRQYELVRLDSPAIQLASNNGGNGPGAGAGAGTGGAKKNARHPGTAEVHVAFADNLDGQIVTGAVDVRTRISWPDREHTPPPRVELYVNQRFVAGTQSRNPRFTIDPSAFAPGANVLQLRASLASGSPVASVPLTVQVPRDFPLPKHPFRPELIFSTYDSPLASGMTPPLTQGDPELATFYSNAESEIDLPAEATGKYRVVIAARGDDFNGPPVMRVTLKAGGQETKIAEAPVPGGPKIAPVDAGIVDLAPGAKKLTIAFLNDAYEKDKGDRNLYVRAVHLAPVDGPDTTKPVAAITVAPKSIGHGAVDAVVANVMDDRRVTSADLLIDDQPQHLDQAPPLGLGQMVFPVLTRELRPGGHRLQVVARDDAGNQGASEEMNFTVTAAAETSPSRYERAIFLLNRFAYGPEPREIAAILTMGEKPWLESRLAQSNETPAEKNEQELLRAQFPDRHDGGQVVQGAIDYLLTEPNPVRARFVMWAENHFSTWITKDTPSAKASEHERFLQLGPVPF